MLLIESGIILAGGQCYIVDCVDVAAGVLKALLNSAEEVPGAGLRFLYAFPESWVPFHRPVFSSFCFFRLLLEGLEFGLR